MRRISKQDIVESIALDAGVSVDKGRYIVDSFLAGILNALRDQRRITIAGFGTFYVGLASPYKLKIRYGERAGTVVDIPQTRRIVFRPAAIVKQGLQTIPADKLEKIYAKKAAKDQARIDAAGPELPPRTESPAQPQP